MECLHPLFIKNPHWGTALQTNEDTLYIKVPCGKCINCQNNRRSSWVLRNRYENINSISSLFITLTYSDYYLPFSKYGIPSLNYEDVKKFMKRLRKRLGKLDIKLKYFLCGEYGSKTLRPHYHAIIYNLPPLDNGKDFIEYYQSLIRDIWQNGNVICSNVTDNRIGYITKYIIKSYEDRKRFEEFELEKPRLLVSRGLGSGLSTRINTECGSIRFFGHSYAVPRYVSCKFKECDEQAFNEFERRRKEFCIRRSESADKRNSRLSKVNPFRDTRSRYITECEQERRKLKRCKTQKDF